MQVGRFRVLSEHAHGGMGVLWRGQDDTLDRPVAIKLLNPERLHDVDALARFRREALAVARLKHDHIAALYEFCDDPEQPYLAMEWVEGASLEERLRSGRLELPLALDLLQQLLSALDYAHAQGVVHRDIKPANLMLSGAQRLTVVDFGLACLLAEPSITATGPLYGTPLYLAPEMAGGGPVDGRADLYSAALVFFEMLTAKAAFGPGTVMQILAQHVHAPRPLLSESRPDLPLALDAVLVKALAADPTQRYPTGASLLQALRHASQPAPGRSRLLPLGLATVSLALVLVAALWPRPQISATVTATPTPRPRMQPAWRLPAPYAPLIQAGDRLLVSAPGQLCALQPSSGKVLWQVAQKAAPAMLVASEKAILRLSGGGSLEAFKIHNGQQIWKVPVPGDFLQGILSSDEELYLLSPKRLQAFDPGPPQQDWEIELPSPLLNVPPVANDAFVVVAGKGHQLSAYRYESHLKAWQTTLSATPTQLWLGEQGLLVGCQDGEVALLTPDTGRKTWEVTGLYGQPVMNLVGDADWLAVAWKDGELATFDSDGDEAWKLQLGEAPSGLTIHQDRLLVATASGRLLCLDLAKGQQLWHTSSPGPCQSPPLWIGDRILLPLRKELLVLPSAPQAPP